MVLLRVIATALMSMLLPLAAPPGASVAQSPVAQSPAYIYGTAHIPSVTTDARAERGPPATDEQHFTTDDAVDLRSLGVSTRLHAPASAVAFAYDHPAQLVEVAQAAGTTREADRALLGDPPSLTRSDVAANAGVRACANSFTGDTLVLMADGSKKPIKDVKLGDKVMATDPETGETGPRKVLDLIRHGGLHTMVAVRLADGATIV